MDNRLISVLLRILLDDSYDLTKDIDMTITVGGDLSIPGSGTERIHVGRNYGFGRQQCRKS